MGASPEDDNVIYLGQEFAFFVHLVPGLLPFLAVFHFRGNRTYLYALKGRSEVVVERERVSRIHISSWRVFLQDLELGTGQGLEIPL